MSQSVSPSQIGGSVGKTRTSKDRAKLFTRFAQLGDSARNQQKWSLAAIYYDEALRIDPDRAGYWVQFGHALKESGEKAHAELAYRTAIKLQPTNADTFLQLGHVLKMQGQQAGAVEAYARAAELAPSDISIRDEYVFLKGVHDKEEAAKAAATKAAQEKEAAQKKPAAEPQKPPVKP